MSKFERETCNSTEMLRAAPVSANPVGVDRENNVINGYIVAQLGVFKTARGEFTSDSLKAIAKLMNNAGSGVPVNYGHHQDAGSSDTLDAFLGMSKNARVDGDKVRADLHFMPDASGRAEKLMQRAEHAPGSFGSSLVLQAEKLHRLDNRGHRKLSADGSPLPPIWMPLAVMGSDVVAVGDAVHGGFLSPDEGDADELLRARNRNRKRKMEGR